MSWGIPKKGDILVVNPNILEWMSKEICDSKGMYHLFNTDLHVHKVIEDNTKIQIEFEERLNNFIVVDKETGKFWNASNNALFIKKQKNSKSSHIESSFKKYFNKIFKDSIE